MQGTAADLLRNTHKANRQDAKDARQQREKKGKNAFFHAYRFSLAPSCFPFLSFFLGVLGVLAVRYFVRRLGFLGIGSQRQTIENFLDANRRLRQLDGTALLGEIVDRAR